LHKFNKWVYFIATSLLLIGCGGGSSTSSCSIEEQNSFVYNYMQKNYLWYEQIPTVDYKSYNSPEALLEDLKAPLDKWSFIIDKKSLDDYFSGGEYIGYGFQKIKKDNKLYIALVFPNSPAQEAGLKRGMQILKINGKSVDSMSDEELNSALGEDKVGVEATLEVSDNGVIKNITMSKSVVKISSVIAKKILSIDGKRYGYLMFNSFIEPSFNELDSAFKYFKDENVDSLIIDLRYNGGGLLSVANHLANLMVGNIYSGSEFVELHFNDKNSNLNRKYTLQSSSYSLGIDEVYFITTSYSCSASEAVINGLKPYINTYIIGQRSCGKPVGMVGGEFCSKYIMPIEFKILNSADEGDYFDGIATNCTADDDITKDFGDLEEGMLKEVKYFIENSRCSLGSNRALRVIKSPTLKGFKSIFNLD